MFTPRLKRILMTVVLVLTLVGMLKTKADVDWLIPAVQRLQPDILDLSVLDSCGIITNGSWHGSCVAIRPNLILTAGHCIDSSSSWIEITGIRCKIKRQWRSSKHDVGLVVVDVNLPYLELGNDPGVLEWRSSKHDVGLVVVDVNLPYLELGNDPGVLDSIYLIGSPYKVAFANKISRGIVCKTNLYYTDSVVNWGGNFVCDAMSWKGGSGGPVLNKKGKIVGMYVGLFSAVDNFSVCEPVSHIKEALEEYDNAGPERDKTVSPAGGD